MIAFTNKQEYLTWRNQWKAAYKTLSLKIRDLKFARWFSDSTRGGVKMSEAQVERYNAIAKENSERGGFCPNYTVAKLRTQATAMLEERKESKKLAQANYLVTQQLRSEKALTTC